MNCRGYLPSVSVLIVACTLSLAQQKPANPPASGIAGPGRQVIPAQVMPERTIQFKPRAPSAADVQLTFGGDPGSGQRSRPMTKGEDGVWSLIVGPVEPDQYNYSFNTGGATVNACIVEVPGNAPLPLEVQNVPHGISGSHRYFSVVQNRQRKMKLCLPPEYFTESGRRC